MDQNVLRKSILEDFDPVQGLDWHLFTLAPTLRVSAEKFAESCKGGFWLRKYSGMDFDELFLKNQSEIGKTFGRQFATQNKV